MSNRFHSVLPINVFLSTGDLLETFEYELRESKLTSC